MEDGFRLSLAAACEVPVAIHQLNDWWPECSGCSDCTLLKCNRVYEQASVPKLEKRRVRWVEKKKMGEKIQLLWITIMFLLGLFTNIPQKFIISGVGHWPSKYILNLGDEFLDEALANNNKGTRRNVHLADCFFTFIFFLREQAPTVYCRLDEK